MHSCVITVNLCIRYITDNKPLSLSPSLSLSRLIDSIPNCSSLSNHCNPTAGVELFLLYPSVLASPVSGDQPTGCSYQWCMEIPRIEIPQFMVGFVVATAAYPFCLTLSGSIYSKVLGNINPVRLDKTQNYQNSTFNLNIVTIAYIQKAMPTTPQPQLTN